jgi:hypothetical protein
MVEKKAVVTPKPAPAARPRPVEVSAKPAPRSITAAPKARATTQPTHRRIDQEFGF